MIRIGDSTYRLCLLDTGIVSEMVKDETRELLRNFYDWAYATEPAVIPCFAIYTVFELRRRPDVFQRFLAQFRLRPCALLKGYAQLIEEEVACYPDASGIDPTAIWFTHLGDEGNQLANLPLIMELAGTQREDEWNAAEPAIVEGMLSLVANYSPEGDAYTRAEVDRFVWMASFQQLVLHHPEWVSNKLERDAEVVDLDAFPTLKAMTSAVFHKFYDDAGRRARRSDAFDVLISSALPYVDGVITEAHLAEALRKTKRRGDFLQHLDVFTLRDFLSSAPSRS